MSASSNYHLYMLFMFHWSGTAVLQVTATDTDITSVLSYSITGRCRLTSVFDKVNELQNNFEICLLSINVWIYSESYLFFVLFSRPFVNIYIHIHTLWLKKTGPLLHLAYRWQIQSNNNIFWHRISLFIYKLIVKATR